MINVLILRERRSKLIEAIKKIMKAAALCGCRLNKQKANNCTMLTPFNTAECAYLLNPLLRMTSLIGA